jgi:hypothetical protein
MTRSIISLSIAALVLTLGACNLSDEVAPSDAMAGGAKGNIKKFYGSTQPLGNGTVRAWTMFSGNTPVEIGVDISAKAMESLPHHHVMMSLPFHPVKNTGTYTHALVDWAPHGHEPAFYEVPHFDFHFYTQSEAERMAIGPNNIAEFDNHPELIYLPENHMAAGGVPQMGVHWVDLMSPEFQGQPFTRTFIYGTYDGKVTFYEPMITKEWMMEQTNTVIPIPQPQAFQEDGWYPTDYRVTYTTRPNTYTVAMSLVWREGQ